jgi:uncharacterized membrane-anchored protein
MLVLVTGIINLYIISVFGTVTFAAKYVYIYFSYYETNKSTIGFVTALSICHKVVFAVWIFIFSDFVVLLMLM